MSSVIVKMDKHENVLQKKIFCFSANFNMFYLFISKYLLTHTHTHTHIIYIGLLPTVFFFTYLLCTRAAVRILINSWEKCSLMFNSVCPYVSLRGERYGLQVVLGTYSFNDLTNKY